MRFTRNRYNDLNDAVGRRREAAVLARRGPGSGAQLLPSFPAYTLSRNNGITRRPALALRLCQQGNAQSAGAAVAPVAARER